MRRVQLLEFEDLDWFPQSWRRMITEVLQFFSSRLNPYGPLVPRLKQVLEELNCHHLIDLCSGGSGPLRLLLDQLENQEHYPVQATLTDKFPNLEAFRQARAACPGKIHFSESPVDAREVPSHLKGFRTLFASFHHFPPEAAKQILQDAARKNEGIGIFEFTDRSLALYLVMLTSPLFVWLVTPLIRPFSWQRLLWTYLIPVLPLLIIWDGMVSNFRTYSPVELKRLVQDIRCDHYQWEIGKTRSRGGYRITYLFGYPVEASVGRL